MRRIASNETSWLLGQAEKENGVDSRLLFLRFQLPRVSDHRTKLPRRELVFAETQLLAFRGFSGGGVKDELEDLLALFLHGG